MNTQAVFSLKGKPLNSYGLTKKIVYENEEFNLVQAALTLKTDQIFDNVVIATDADVDGMHIRLLLIHSSIFPELIREGHLYIHRPLFRFVIRETFIVTMVKKQQPWRNCLEN